MTHKTRCNLSKSKSEATRRRVDLFRQHQAKLPRPYTPRKFKGATTRLYLSILALFLAGLACNSTVSTDQLITTSPPIPPTIQVEKRYLVGPPSLNSNLDTLNSYRANLIVDFKGDKNNQPATGHIESLTERNRTTNALHHYFYVTPVNQIEAEISEFYQVDDNLHLITPQKTLFLKNDAVPSPAQFDLPDLSALIALPHEVNQPPQAETFNGRAVQHYRFTQDDLDSPGLVFSQAQGDIWITEAGRYVAQYTISATVAINTPVPNTEMMTEGQLNISYTLTDINRDITITPPGDLAITISPLAKLPRPNDAQITAVFPTMLAYTTAISPISATLFYKDYLPSQGWTEESAEVFEEKSYIRYRKDNEIVTITVAPLPESNQIKVLLDSGP